MISIWLPIIVTVLGLLWIFLFGRILPGVVDEIYVFIIVIAIWGIWFIFKALAEFVSSTIGATTVGVVASVIALAYYKKWR